MKPSRFFELLLLLSKYEVSFIVVGGVAAIVEGAPVTTLDLDVVFEQEGENVTRLAQALASLHAVYRDPAGRRILPDEQRLATTRTNLLATDLGPLDALAEIGDGERYESLLKHSHARALGGATVQVLSLEKVIETKEAANRDKDRAVLPILRRALELQRHGQR